MTPALSLPRLRRLAVPLLLALAISVLAAAHAHAETIDPAGIGDLLPSPASRAPHGQGTLYEDYSRPELWFLDDDYGHTDVFDPPVNAIANVLMGLVVTLGTAVTVVVSWIFETTSIPELQNDLTTMIGGAAENLALTLLPAALCVGGFVAFARHKDGGGAGGLSQVAWVVVSGVVAVSLLQSPQTWVEGVDSTRQIGSSIAMNAASDGIGTGVDDFPFKMTHQPAYTGTGRDDMLRKSTDAVWRTYVAGPWCIAEFGSLEVCRKYGQKTLDQGVPGTGSTRKSWLQDNLTGGMGGTVGRDSELWWEGHKPVQRVMVCLFALVCISIFAALVLALAFASLASLLGALMLLVCGVVFACMWVIPGRSRQWGLRWFDQLLGFTLQSFIVTMVLSCVLVLQVATTKMISPTGVGWLPAAGLSIAAALVALRFRRVLESIIGVSGVASSPMGAVLGLMAARGAMRAVRGLGGGRTTGRSGTRRSDDGPLTATGGSGSGGGTGAGGGGVGHGGGGVGGRGPGGGGLARRPAVMRAYRRPSEWQPKVSVAGDAPSLAGPPHVPDLNPAAVPAGGGINPTAQAEGPGSGVPRRPVPAPQDSTAAGAPAPPVPTRGLPAEVATTGRAVPPPAEAGLSRAAAAIHDRGAPEATEAEPDLPSPAVSFRQLPPPGAPGPRQIAARTRPDPTTARERTTKPTPGTSATRRRPVTQPAPPRRRRVPVHVQFPPTEEVPGA
ncbi:hypothetical protein [Streptomyces sp. NPDC089919]|uniref:hypothetical protein n=1 Tax=Streptomyces sp. NPDC089919 TaxID=3155188 RepID=UPI00341DA589